MNNQNPLSIENLFNNVSSKYDLLNDLLSFGLHRIWKKQVLLYLKPKPGEHWLDLCCGTGDMSFHLARSIHPKGKVIGVDFAEQSLQIARRRHLKESWLRIYWMNLDAQNTGFDSAIFDGVVMAYGLRNLKNPLNGLIEIRRVLKPGSKAALLDFNKMKKGSAGNFFQKYYLRNFVVRIANLFNLRKEYQYIEESINLFPDGPQQVKLAFEAGFRNASHRLIAGGQMGILCLST